MNGSFRNRFYDTQFQIPAKPGVESLEVNDEKMHHHHGLIHAKIREIMR
jgi:hypothetical protein